MNQHILPNPAEIEAALGLGRKAKARRWLSRLLWLVALMAIAGAGYYVYNLRQQAVSLVVYDTVSPETRDITVLVAASGAIQPLTQVDVSSELSGVVRDVLVEENALVKKGDVLARIDTRKLENQIARSRAQLAASEARRRSAVASLAEAQTNDERQKALRRRGLSTDQNADQAASALLKAQASLEAAEADTKIYESDIAVLQTDIDRATILSPIDGIILSRKVEPGQTVVSTSSSPTLFTIAEDLKRIQVEVSVDEADIGQVKAGQKASFVVDAYRGESFPASIVRLSFASTTVDGVVSYKAVLSATNPDLRLRPGMTATARIVVEEHDKVFAIPNEAFRFQPPQVQKSEGFSVTNLFLPRFPRAERGRRKVEPDGTRALYVLRDGAPVEVKVKTGATDGRFTQMIGEGLTLDDKLVTGSRSAMGR